MPFCLLAKGKITDAAVLRKVALEGARITPQEALKDNLIDAIAPSGSTADVLAKAQEIAASVSDRAKPGAWGLIRVSKLSPTSMVEVFPDARILIPERHPGRGHRGIFPTIAADNSRPR